MHYRLSEMSDLDDSKPVPVSVYLIFLFSHRAGLKGEGDKRKLFFFVTNLHMLLIIISKLRL